MPKKRTVTQHVQVKVKKASTWASIAGLAAGLAPLFPQYSAAIAAAGLVAGTIGTFMPQPGSQEGGTP